MYETKEKMVIKIRIIKKKQNRKKKIGIAYQTISAERNKKLSL